MVKKLFFIIHACIFFQGSSDLDEHAYLLFDQFFLTGLLRLRIQRMVLLSRLMDKDWNHSWSCRARRVRQPFWRIWVTQSDCSQLWRVWLKTQNFALVGGKPHYFPYHLIYLVCYVFVVIFKVVSAVQVWGRVLLRCVRLVSPIWYCISGHIKDNVSIQFWGGIDIYVCYFCCYFYCFCV
jgi:hypothetical protein